MARISKPTYDYEFYFPSNIVAEIKTGHEKAIRKEYTRLRDITQKRLKRLAAAGYADTQTYKQNVAHYPKLKDIKSIFDLAQRLSDLANFVKSPGSTVSGLKSRRQKTLEKLHEHEYSFVNESNLDEYGEFMEEYRNQKLDQEYDSGDAYDTFKVMEKHGIDPKEIKDDFEFWLENKKTAEKLRKSKASYGDPSKLRQRVEAANRKKARKK